VKLERAVAYFCGKITDIQMILYILKMDLDFRVIYDLFSSLNLVFCKITCGNGYWSDQMSWLGSEAKANR
jgi:hypothetical protein